MTPLASFYVGWEGHPTSLFGAVVPWTPEQLAWRPAAQRRSVGEIVRQIAPEDPLHDLGGRIVLPDPATRVVGEARDHAEGTLPRP